MGKVVAGFFSLTEVTDPAAHGAYNEWHQLDHLPEQLPLDGIVSGQRWVRTPACRAAGRRAEGTLDAIHYLTLYLMAEPLDATLADFAGLARRLRGDDRFFEHRRSHLSGPFDLVGAVAAPRVRVSAEAVAHRPGRGIYVAVERPARPADPVAEVVRATNILNADGVAGVWTFAARPPHPDQPWQPGDHRITVCFLDAEPVAVAAALDPLFAPPTGGAGPHLVYAGPLESITPWEWDWFDGGGNGEGH